MQLNLDFGVVPFLIGMIMAFGYFIFFFFLPYKKYYVPTKVFRPLIWSLLPLCIFKIVVLIGMCAADEYSSGFTVGYFITFFATVITYFIVRFGVRTKRIKKNTSGYTNVEKECSSEDSDDFTTKNGYWIMLCVYFGLGILMCVRAGWEYNNRIVVYRDTENKIQVSELNRLPCVVQYNNSADFFFFEKGRVAVKNVPGKKFNVNKQVLQEIADDTSRPFSYISYEKAEVLLRKN